jgi:hypothetical protein
MHDVLERLKFNADSNKAIRKEFYLKRHLFVKLKLIGPFDHWKNVLLEQKLLETAKWFHHNIWPRHTLRQAFAALKLHYTNSSMENVKTRLIRERNEQALKKRVFSLMMSKMKTTFDLNQRAAKVVACKGLKALRVYFFAMQRQCIILKNQRNNRD